MLKLFYGTVIILLVLLVMGLLVSNKFMHGNKNGKSDFMFRKNSNLVVWSSDFHIGPLMDLKYTWRNLNISWLDQSLSGHCHIPDTCATELRVLLLNWIF